MKRFLGQINTNERFLTAFLAFVAVSLLAGFSFGQTKESKECKDKKTTKAVITPRPEKPVSFLPAPTAPPVPIAVTSRVRTRVGGDSHEKSITVHPKVYVSFCVSSGKVNVNGWNRNEVRAFVDNGRTVDFKVIEKKSDKTPVWIEVVGYEKRRSFPRTRRSTSRSSVGSGRGVGASAQPFIVRDSGTNTCLMGKEIELDVPKNASVKIKSDVSETSVDTVKWVEVLNNDGDIYLNRINNGIKAKTYGGNLVVKESGGKMNVSTTDGSIIAYKTETNEIGDYLKAKTQGGSVTLQSVGQREVEVNSVSGAVNYIGNLANYGRYSFSSHYGVIRLAVPEESSCSFKAVYGGVFRTNFSIKDLEKKRDGDFSRVNGRIGEGSCELSFSTVNGSISFMKLPKKRTKIASAPLRYRNFNLNFKFLP